MIKWVQLTSEATMLASNLCVVQYITVRFLRLSNALLKWIVTLLTR